MKILAILLLTVGLLASSLIILLGGRATASVDAAARRDEHERFLYVATIAQSESDPDFVTIVGADPRKDDFGQIVSRIDMPNVGDELHHFGYSYDQNRLIVPGLFSNRIHLFRINGDGKSMKLQAVNEELVANSGYILPAHNFDCSAWVSLLTCKRKIRLGPQAHI
ncbi:MAG TPA: selenium-binding protein SBP56-related protein [Pyrinomonadaceae bacterium]